MASLFWVGGSTAYDGVTNTLATTTGGSATVAVITSADTVTFDASSPAAAVVITSAAISCSTLTLDTGFTGSLTLSNPLTASGAVTLTQGTLNTNGQACTMASLGASNSNVRTLSLGTSTITLTSSGTVFTVATGTNLTLNATASTIVMTDTSASNKTFGGGGKPYNTLSITTGGSGTITINGSNTFNNLITTGGSTKTIRFAAGKSDYLSLQDSAAAGGAVYYAGSHSTSVSGNSGWTFADAPESNGAISRRSEFIYRSIPTIGSGTPVDLWLRYLVTVTGSTTLKTIYDLEMLFLRQKGGTGETLMDLWSSYLLSKGFTQGTIHDRQLAFFMSGTQT